ncbi:hypothetical protein [Paenibacillus macerans]|uniref:hypothetical protein n=1 Tax=Paenibacillus macerans TaxID=44252 RepID=UPI003D310030
MHVHTVTDLQPLATVITASVPAKGADRDEVAERLWPVRFLDERSVPVEVASGVATKYFLLPSLSVSLLPVQTG